MDYKEKEKLIASGNGITNECISINRRVYLQEDLNSENQYDSTNPTLLHQVKKKIQNESAKDFILNLIPALKWMIRYNCKENLLGDVLSGFTIAIMHVPQGMAYALLGNVPPIYGLYMAFFPVIIYTFLGTSRHNSMGTFAIICLMSGNVISQVTSNSDTIYDATHIAGTVSFTVGIILLIMYLIRAGIIADLLSETLVSSFTCASAFHIMSSQFKDLLGVSNIQRANGNFRLIKTVYRVGEALPSANNCALIISAISMFVLLANNYLLKPWLAKRTKIPFPIELFVVLTGTMASYFLDLSKNYNISMVGDIPTGFPDVRVPLFEIVPDILYDCFFIALVSYTITMSMALMFATKKHYEVRSNQELFAMGVSDIVGSFFSCMPISASLSRSVIQFEVGGKTQIASLVSCSMLVFVLLWIGPFFEPLPKAVLASIIIVALTSMIMQVKEVKKFWKLSKWDFTVWISTFLTTLLVNIDIGLCVGLILSLTSIFVRGYKPYTCLLGIVPGTDLYLDMNKYKSVRQVPGVNIFRYCGGLNFATKATFKELLWKKVGFDATKVFRKIQHNLEPDVDIKIKCIIVDFSSLTFIDPQGVHILSEIKESLDRLDIQLYIACCSVPVYEVLQRVNRYYEKHNEFMIFPTIHDAVLFGQANLPLSKKYDSIATTIVDIK